MSDYPSLSEQAKNLAKFTFEVLKFGITGNALTCSNETVLKRKEICSTCDRLDPVPNRCRECGCFLDAKVHFSLEACPLGKWRESDDAWMNGKFEEFLEQQRNCCPENHTPPEEEKAE